MASRSFFCWFASFAVAGLCWGAANSAAAMELRIVQAGLPLQAQLIGEIRSGDAQRIIAALQKAEPADLAIHLRARAPSSLYDPAQWLWLDVESEGGNAAEAMAIGRFLRSANALIVTRSNCTSACVFLLAGAVERVTPTSQSAVIGVHRPYSEDARGATPVELDRIFQSTRRSVEEYMDQMHVSPRLVDLMYATPPEQMHMLSADELNVLLPERDPVWDELTVARRAAIYGIPSATYRRDEVQAFQGCAANSSNGAVPPACRPATTLGVPIDEFAARTILFAGRCTLGADLYDFLGGGNAGFLTCAAPAPGHQRLAVENENTIAKSRSEPPIVVTQLRSEH